MGEDRRIDRLLEKDDYRSFSSVEISALQDEVRRLRTTKREVLEDVETVAELIVGWWPGLEDPIFSTQHGGQGNHPAHDAAKRLLRHLRADHPHGEGGEGG